ncbi:MAG: hypothetical protein AAGK21_09615 [Bacteroidota bacterium]
MTDTASFARVLRLVWLAVTSGATLVMGVLGYLAASGEPPQPDLASTLFYGVAVLSMVATAVAFWLIRQMETRLLNAGSNANARGIVQGFGIAALAAAETPAILGAIAAYLTGDLLALAFGVTMYAFAALTWPSDGRVAYWLGMHEAR